MFEMRAKIITVGLLGAATLLPVDFAEAAHVGSASWYALRSRTASGEMMNPSELTAAHRSLPFGTKVLVENLHNGRSVVVRINDRGPFAGGRIIDLSKAAATSIGMVNSGVAKVRVTPTQAAKTKASAARAPSKLTYASKDTKRAAKIPRRAKPSSKRAAKSPHRGKLSPKHATKRPNRVEPSAKLTRVASKRAPRKAIAAPAPNLYLMVGGTPGFLKPDTKRVS